MAENQRAMEVDRAAGVANENDQGGPVAADNQVGLNAPQPPPPRLLENGGLEERQPPAVVPQPPHGEQPPEAAARRMNRRGTRAGWRIQERKKIDILARLQERTADIMGWKVARRGKNWRGRGGRRGHNGGRGAA